MLKAQIIGHLGKDAEIKEVNGQYVIEFSVAHSVKDKSGSSLTTWVKCSFWKQTRDNCRVAEFLKKGTQVHVHGDISARAYLTKSGEAAPDLSIRVSDLQLLGSGKSDENVTTNTTNTKPVMDVNIDNDLPF